MYLIYKTPIFFRKGDIFGYEIFTKTRGSCIYWSKSTASSLNNLINFLLEGNIVQLFKDKKVIVPIDCKELNVEFISLLIPNRVILKIVCSEAVNINFLKSIELLKSKGFRIILESFHFGNPNFISLLKRADYLSFSVKALKNNRNIKEFAVTLNKKIFVTNIENEEEYKRSLEVADYLEGPFLAEPRLFRHHKNYQFLSGFLKRLIKHIRERTKEELENIIKSDENLTKLAEWWSKEFYSNRELDDFELRVIIFLYLVKDMFFFSKRNVFIKSLLFRAFVMRNLAEILNPEKSREAFITGLLSWCEDFLEISSVNLAESLEYSDDIVEALKDLSGYLGYLLSNAYLIESCTLNGDEKKEGIYLRLGYLFNRKPEEIEDIVKRAEKNAEELITLLRTSGVRGNRGLPRRNRLARL